MGAVIQGGVALDQIQFNEKTLWTGGPGSTQGYDFGLPKEPRLEALAKVRKTLEAQGRMKPEAVAQQLGLIGEDRAGRIVRRSCKQRRGAC